MRIVLVLETYFPHINGVATHVHSLRVGLERLGHQVLIVCGDNSYGENHLENGVLYCPGIVVPKFYGYTLSQPWGIERAKIIANFNPDVIHIHTEFGLGLFAMNIAKKLEIPLVYTLHTMYDDYVYYLAPPPLISAATKLSHQYFKRFLKAADEVTGPSLKCQEYADAIGTPRDITVVPNPVEIDKFDPEIIKPEDILAVREKFNLSADRKYVAFVGRLGKEKSADKLLEYWNGAVSEDDNLTLLIIGDGPEKEPLEILAGELALGERVKFLGKVPHDEMPPYLALCSLYITASLSDTNSISMLEGQAMGLAVLQKSDPLNEGQVLEGINGFVYDDASELKAKLALVMAMNADEEAKLRQTVRGTVLSKGYETLANNLLAVYEKALHKHKDDVKHTPPRMKIRRRMNNLKDKLHAKSSNYRQR